MNQNKTIVEQVRKVAGDKLADTLQKQLDKKFTAGRIAIKSLIDGKTLAEASKASKLPEKNIIAIVYNLNRKGSHKEIRYKRLLPLLPDGEPNLSVLPIKIK